MAKRRLDRIRLDKIAAVDKPCQQHATVAIIKRAPGDPAAAIAKATYQEALNGAMVSERVNRAFWDNFDGLWQRNDAFRTALTDELADGGDGAVASAAYLESVNELVETAVTAARSAGAKASDEEISKAIEDAVTSWVESQPQHQEHTMKITTKAQLKTAVAAFDITKSTYGDLTTIAEAAVDLDAIDELPADGPLAKAAEDKKKEKGKAKDEDTPAFKALQREVAVLKMDTATKTFFDTLDAAGQDAFLAKSAADQAAQIESITKGDPILYTCEDGTAIRKSDGAVAAMLARQNDSLSKTLKSVVADQQGNAIEKRARTEFPNVALGEATDMLKAVDELGADSVSGKAILKTLKTMNKSRDGLFTTLGTTEAPELGGDIRKARNDFDTEVKKVASRDKIGLADAMSKVRSESPDLYAAAFPENAEAEAAAE
jgi:hypothetical protein